MDCPRIQERLSAYFDGELPSGEQSAVAEHIEDCPQCGRYEEDLRKLSTLSRQTTTPDPPADFWVELERRLDVDHRTPTKLRRLPLWAKGATLAALILIAVGTGLWSRRFQSPNDAPPQMAVDLDSYLNDFQRDPQKAPNILIARYNGHAVSLDEVAKEVRYRPVASGQLPEGFSLDAVYLLKMECCTGVQSVYKRKGSEIVAILQHTIDQPVWFGDRAVLVAKVHGKPTRIVQVDGRLAATWQLNGTYVSMIGIEDMTELTRFIGYLEHKPKEN